MGVFVVLDVRRVPKAKFHVLLSFSVSPRELMDRQMHPLPHVFVLRKSTAKPHPFAMPLLRGCLELQH